MQLRLEAKARMLAKNTLSLPDLKSLQTQCRGKHRNTNAKKREGRRILSGNISKDNQGEKLAKKETTKERAPLSLPGKMSTGGPHTCYYMGINFPIAQGICYTGRSGRNSFVEFGRLRKVFFESANYTKILKKIMSQLHAHLLHKRIVSELFM